MAAENASGSISKKAPGVLVPFLGELLTGATLLFLAVSSGATSGFGLIVLLFGVLFLVSAALTWRLSRIGYILGIVASAIFLLLFGFSIPTILTSFADQASFVEAMILVPALVITLVYSVAGIRTVRRKGAMQKQGRMIPMSSLLAVLALGFVIGGASIGVIAGGQIVSLVHGSGAKADIVIVPNAAGGVGQPYSPANFTVKVGTSVTWLNNDTTTHTVTSTSVPNGAKTFDSGNLAYGFKYNLTFTMPGTYDYYCSIHPSMKGIVTVTA